MIPTAASTMAKYTHAIARCRAVLPVALQVEDTTHDHVVRVGEGINDGKDKARQDHGADIGQGDLPEVFPRRRTLHLRRLLGGDRNVLERRQEDQNLDAGVPDDAEDVVRHRFNGGLHTVGDAVDAQELHQLTQQVSGEHGGKLAGIAVAGALQVAVDDVVHRTGGNDDREEEHGTGEGPSLELLVQNDCHEQGEHQNQRRFPGGVFQHLDQVLAVVRVYVERIVIVVQSHKRTDHAAGGPG